MKCKKGTRERLIVCYFTVLTIWAVVFLCVVIHDYKKINSYKNKVFYNTYLGKYNISNKSINKLDETIDSYSEKVLSKKIKLVVNGKDYLYEYSDLGVSLNKDKIKKEILEYQEGLTYFDKTTILNLKTKKIFNFEFTFNKESITNLINSLKNKVDVPITNGYISVNENREVSYVLGIDSFSLDVEKSVQKIMDDISKKGTIELVGSSKKAVNDENYKLIDTKVSSFTTDFNPNISRATNLRTALAYIDGAIIPPGEIFSFYNYAGPYNKEGYVFYYEFVGNGVCQIATTVYNAALLGGLEIVKRYPHAKKSVYVDGGLDATVASYASGWNVDFQFKNTYKYPIYISAYSIDGKAHVDFWSNSDATEGKSYSTESVKLGARYYQTYLHTYKNGEEIDKSLIASTWYTKD